MTMGLRSERQRRAPRSVFVNPEHCIGCRQYEFACAVEHSRSNDQFAAFLEDPVPRTRVHVEAGDVPSTSFPNRCRHCDPAPCQQVCPTGAVSRDDEMGVVLIEATRCIGCAMCAVVCPFDVISFYPLAEGPDPQTDVAVKCDGCIDRQRRHEVPACAEACKVEALVYGELNELIRSGRVRETRAVLGAADLTHQPAADPLAGWHAWGDEILTVAAAAHMPGHNHHNGHGNGHGPAKSTNKSDGGSR